MPLSLYLQIIGSTQEIPELDELREQTITFGQLPEHIKYVYWVCRLFPQEHFRHPALDSLAKINDNLNLLFCYLSKIKPSNYSKLSHINLFLPSKKAIIFVGSATGPFLIIIF